MKLTKLGLGLFASSTMIAPTALANECRAIERFYSGDVRPTGIRSNHATMIS